LLDIVAAENPPPDVVAAALLLMELLLEPIVPGFLKRKLFGRGED
jgi:hypothetical protein